MVYDVVIAFGNSFDNGIKNFNNRDSKMKIDYFEVVLKTLIVLGVILIVYWFLQIMFGGSPSLEQFNVGFILVLMGLIVQLYYKYGMFNQFVKGTFPRFEKNVEDSFNRMKDDMDLIKKKLKI